MKALQHVYPQWRPPQDDPAAPLEDYREVWTGSMRIVRNRKRIRVLKKRGVPLMDLRDTYRCVAWFVE